MEKKPISPQEELTPVFEAFYLETEAPQTVAYIHALVSAILDPRWRVQRVSHEEKTTDFDVVPEPEVVLPSVGEAWSLSYQLQSLPGVVYAEPIFKVAVYEPPAVAPVADHPFEAAESVEMHLAGSEDPDWALRLIRVPEAWQDFFQNDPEEAGKGIIIGHPDTGYRWHPEVKDRLLWQKGFDYVNNDHDPLDDLTSSLKVALEHKSHGLSTSSVIISPPKAQATYTPEPGGSSDADSTKKAVTGVAPGARLIPIRASRTVVLLSMYGLALAINWAVRQGAHVISISMGGVWNRRLKKAVRHAEEEGVIVCAAAGNKVRITVWPANYPEVVSVAACNVDRCTWSGSSRGKGVNVTAPGESVWRARDHLDHEGNTTSHVGRGSGTSYAVAHVAGAAALWLSHHGRDALVARYGKARIPSLFREVLAASSSDNHQLPGKGFGAGLLDVHALLSHPLPEVSPFEAAEEPPVPMEEESTKALFETLFDIDDTMASPFEAAEESEEEQLRRTLTRLLHVDPAKSYERLEEVGNELAFHLMTNEAAFDAFAAALQAPQFPASPFEHAESTENGVETVKSQLENQDLSGTLQAYLRS